VKSCVRSRDGGRSYDIANNEVLVCERERGDRAVITNPTSMTNMTSFTKAAYAVAFLLTVLLPTTVVAQSAPSSDADQTYFDFQVEQAVRVRAARQPVIPERLRSGFEGQVLVQFVVDERGVAQMNTFKILKSTDNDLNEPVRRAVTQSTYFPAEYQGRKVKQLVQQPFLFKLAH
jgi:TonB family protein